jgi:hypothetical protein
MKKRHIITTTLLLSVVFASFAIAGHHYYGHGHMMSSWNLTDMDSDQDGVLSFEEFGASHMDKLRSGFNMIDTDKDGTIGANEWNEFLRVHGINAQ